MTVAVDNGQLIATGASADVLYMGHGRVLKAFLRRAHTAAPVVDWRDHESLSAADFRFEAAAYERLQSYPELARFTPAYFGKSDPTTALSEAGGSDRYVRGCGILLEFIPGTPSKLVHLEPSIRRRAERILEHFEQELGFGHVWDSSCFVPGARSDFALIDFATWDGFHDYQVRLNERGSLGSEFRKRLDAEYAA